ncbi:MAG: hypothetical protein JW885_14150 [Deltaproteobacteria bacterium]|nr:hypothetical protein [Candidatus Zymogenaceae bacterium]
MLISPLAWGLGHATRDIPIIKMLLEEGHSIGIVATGAPYELLEREYPDFDFYHITDYPSPYTAEGFSVARVVALYPVMFRNIMRETRLVRKIIRREKYDLVISDNRFGIHDERVPSLFISHQIRYSVPGYVEWVEKTSEWFNARYHSNFDRIIIPDNPPDVLPLSGKLGRADQDVTKRKAYYAGILSSIEKIDIPEDIDYLVSVSGPKEQKEKFRDAVMSQITELPGRKVVLLGDPGGDVDERLDENTRIVSHASREEMTRLMNRASFIITRSGYTTVMELAELGGKKALFVPTPGQTEQEYLSDYYKKMGWFYSVSQKDLDLVRDVKRASGYPGLPPMSKSADNARRLYEEVIRGYLPADRKYFFST